MPKLQSLTVTHIDPLCYPDDIATIIFGSPKLDTLKLHWSPRMRDAGEPSIHMQSYLRHNIAAKKIIKLKELAFYNLFALTSVEIEGIVDRSNLQALTMLNSFGLDEDVGYQSSLAAFLDGSWSRPPDDLVRLKSMRHDKMSKRFARHLGDLHGLEKIYLVNARHVPMQSNHQPSTDPSSTSVSTPSTDLSGEQNPSVRAVANTSLRDLCLDAIISSHGATLKHLILPDRWPLPNKIVARLFNGCPHITQLALALESKDSFGGMRILLPFLKKIHAVRILVPGVGLDGPQQLRRFDCIVNTADEQHEKRMAQELVGDDFPNLRYVGIGWKVWEIGGTYETLMVSDEGQEEMVMRRRTKQVGREEVQGVEIWKMDSLDVI